MNNLFKTGYSPKKKIYFDHVYLRRRLNFKKALAQFKVFRRYPLPLYVQLPDNNYQIVRKLSKNMKVKGIVTEHGIYLFEQIVLDKENISCYGDLLPLAQKITPKAHPLTTNDVRNLGHDIYDLLRKESLFSLTVSLLCQTQKEKPYLAKDPLRVVIFFDNKPNQDKVIIDYLHERDYWLPIENEKVFPLFIPATEYNFDTLSKSPKRR